MAHPTIPPEIFSVIPHQENRPAPRYQVIGTAPGTPLGETHIVAFPGEWWVFFRQSRTEQLVQAPLKSGETPRLQNDPFGASLLLPLEASATEAPVSLSPGEIVPVADLLDYSWPAEGEKHLLLETPIQQKPPSSEDESQGTIDKAVAFMKQVGDKTKGAAADQLGHTVDRALDVIEFVAEKAAARGTFSTLKVEAHINMVVGQVAIEVGYTAEDLQKMGDKES